MEVVNAINKATGESITAKKFGDTVFCTRQMTDEEKIRIGHSKFESMTTDYILAEFEFFRDYKEVRQNG